MATFDGKTDFTSPAPSNNPHQNRTPSGGRSLTSISSSSCIFDSPTSPASSGMSPAIPPSPFMQRLGCGTGVSVYLFQRGSKSDGVGLSPWAVKRTVARTQIDHTDSSLEKRLAKEAHLLKQLKHDNIVGFRAFNQTADGRMCLSMENGDQSLLDLIETRDEEGLGPFPASQIYQVALSLARALKYLHTEKHLLHGDLKSGNVLIGSDFKSVKLCDFGVALKLRKTLSGLEDPDDCYIGTEPWSAPEIINEEGPVTDKADIFSYGLIIWEMMSLTLPHVDLLGDSSYTDDESMDESFYEAQYQAALGTRPPPPNFHLGMEYSALVSLFWACTQELPSQRPSASFVVEALESLPIPSDRSNSDCQEDKENLPIDLNHGWTS